jgi:hypothetical protein
VTCGEYFVEPYQISFTGLGARWVVRRYHGTCSCGAVDLTSTPATFEQKHDAVLFSHMKNAELQRTANAKPPEAETHAGGNIKA